MTGRLDRLRALFAEAGDDGQAIGALLVTTPANIRWLSGFSGSAGLLLVTADGALLTTDGRYRTQAAEQLAAAGADAEIDHLCRRGAGPARGAGRRAAAAVGSLGLEADNVTWSAQRTWDGAPGPGGAGPHPGAGRGAADGQGRRRGGPDGAGRGHRRRGAGGDAAPAAPTAGATEPS